MTAEYKLIVRSENVRKRAHQIVDRIPIDAENEKYYQIIFQPYKRDRSAAQNRLMWLWLGIIRKETGNDSHDLKYMFQEKFLEPHTWTDRQTGQQRERVRGTSELNIGEFSEFLNDIDRFANTELGIKLPHPEDMWAEAMGQAA